MAFERSSSWMIEQAKEELQNLEAEHPNRFGYLKLELETFIISAAEAESETKLNIDSYWNYSISSSSLSVSTQASTSSRKRKNCSPQVQNFEANNNNSNVVPWTNRQKFRKLDHQKTSDDAAIERAEACLRKIREIKDSFHYI